MAIQFKETEQKAVAIQNLLEKHDEIAKQISSYSAEDANSIQKLRVELATKWADFSAEERKLNIAVVGRVKAGKSTFLNTVIFNGKHILPEAFTPKTATLTKIEYAESNSLEIEYYSPDEWQELELQAKSADDSEVNRASKELVEAVKNSGVNVAQILSKGNETEKFISEDELFGRLNCYVGENGEITPLVKCVTLKINKPELAGISIVDTPGLNDPVISRTQKTRDFLGLCDVVFFLSPASQFLDKNDVDLLKAQLPQKGVARLILICSRFDDGLVDVIYDVDSLEEAIDEAKTTLKKHAVKIFDKQIEDYRKLGNSMTANLLTECKLPIFVSSLFHNMIEKNKSAYNEAELHAFNNLNDHDDLNSKMLEMIGNIEPVQKCLQSVISQKDSTLAQKADNFIPLAQKNLDTCISDIRNSAKYRYNQLVNNDKIGIEKQQNLIANRIHDLESKLEEVFGNVFSKIESSKISVLHDIRQSSNEYSTLATKTGIEYEETSRTVSDSKWYNPFSWGKSHEVYYTRAKRYSYIDANDALENIRSYARSAISSIENGFIESVDLPDLRRQLLKIIVENFNAADESFDPAHFRLLAEKSINSIEMPIIKIDISNYLNDISGKFSGEIRDSSARSNIQQSLSNIISNLFDIISDKLINEIFNFKGVLTSIKSDFAEQLLSDINQDFEKLKAEYADKEKSIDKIKQYLVILENF